MDNFMPSTSVDIIVWEFTINDMTSQQRPYNVEPGVSLDFFLRSVQSVLLTDVPPPIIILHLWDYGVRTKIEEEGSTTTTTSLGTGVYEDQLSTIQYYSNVQEWNIQVVLVGPSVNVTKLSTDTAGISRLLDDGHHPSCYALKYISKMLAYVIIKDVAGVSRSSSSSSSSSVKTRTTTTTIDDDVEYEPTTTRPATSSKLMEQPLAKRLYGNDEPNLRLASLTRALPNADASQLKIIETTAEETTLGKTDESRQDRIKSWKVPNCDADRLTFTIMEPTLQYLGFGYHTPFDRPPKLIGEPIVTINDKRIQLQTNNAQRLFPVAIRWVQTWIDIPDIGVDHIHGQYYNVSICGVGDVVDLNLRLIVGLIED
jgi:hypothetical protein